MQSKQIQLEWNNMVSIPSPLISDLSWLFDDNTNVNTLQQDTGTICIISAMYFFERRQVSNIRLLRTWIKICLESVEEL